MNRTMTLAEAKAYYNEERCFETETGFLVNDFGKYRPNITFVVPKTYDLDKNGKPINPLHYTEDREVTDNMNLDFDGSASFIFGDFWRSKKGGACFRPKSPMQAKHLLIHVGWGGCFNSYRGNYSDDVKGIDGVLYFRRASSNGGGAGCDYWVLPVGYTRVIHDEEIDGSAQSDHTALFEQRAKAYRKKHADLQKKAVEEADAYLKEKAASEEASKSAKERFIPRLTEIQAELAELNKPQKFGNYGVGSLTLDEAYFKLSYDQYLYSEESLAKAEAYLVRMRDWVTGEEAKKQSKADARETFEPKYEELRGQIERIGWELSFGEEGALVKNPAKVRDTYYYRDNGITTYPYDLDGVENLREDVEKEADRIAEEESRARNAERIRNLLTDTDLPEDLWFLFEGSEDLDSTIRKEVEAILAAVTVEKDEMDMHELCNCGYDRRCDAILRVLERVGGGNAKINIGSQSASKALAWFIAG
ncbi:hypothetical protein IKG06_03620 [Candidatus Saccharibacteria bacterium]|nr:hypothetical protein [Candidatus Saccharibacteria bacterium]